MSSDLTEVGVETAQELLSTETDAEDETSQKLPEDCSTVRKLR